MSDMKKSLLIIQAFCLSVMMTFAETNVSLNKELYVKENLRLRSAETISSAVVTVMETGSKVRIVKLGKEDVIDSIQSNWVKVEVLDGKSKSGENIKKGTKGWCFGGYLVEYKEKFDYLDLSDKGFKIEKIAFNNDIDAAAWEKLVGFYFLQGPWPTIPELREISTTWGKDYGGFGNGLFEISYKDGIWTIGGCGEAETFRLDSISDDGSTFTMKYEHHTEFWRIDGEYLYKNNSPYYKVTGPDCYKRFLREYVRKYNKSVIPYVTNNEDEMKNLENVSRIILNAILIDNLRESFKYLSKDLIVRLKIPYYNGKVDFSYEDLIGESEGVKSAFNSIKSDLYLHRNAVYALSPDINTFLRTTVEDFKTNYPAANYIVEFVFDRYEHISLFFKVENEKIYLVGISDYANYEV